MTLIIFLTALTTFTLILLIYKLVNKEEVAVNVRINKYIQPVKPNVLSTSLSSVSKSWLGIIRYLSHFVKTSPKAIYFNNKLMQAGIPLRGSEFFVIVILLSVTMGLAGFILSKGVLLAGIVMGIATYLIAHLYISYKINKRLKLFNHQLGETLALMANALRSGHSFLQTVDMVSREMTPPISQEFGRMLKEMNLGASTETALDNLLSRVKSDDLDLAVTAIIIQRQIGGNLAEIMDNIAATIRERHMMKREIQTLTAQGRISGLVIGLLPIGLGIMLWIINPNYIGTLFNDPIGLILIGYAVISEIMGFILINKIVTIDM